MLQAHIMWVLLELALLLFSALLFDAVEGPGYELGFLWAQLAAPPGVDLILGEKSDGARLHVLFRVHAAWNVYGRRFVRGLNDSLLLGALHLELVGGVQLTIDGHLPHPLKFRVELRGAEE